MTKTKTKKAVIPGQMGFWERNRMSGGYLLQKKLTNFFIVIARAILLFGMCFLILQPIFTKISISFMEEQDLYSATVIAVPEHFTTGNYQLVSNTMEYSRSLLGTAWSAFVVAVLQIVSTTLVGYGFARFEFPLKKFWFACVIFCIIIPPQTISTSLYTHFRFFDILGLIKLITGGTINLRGSALPYFMLSLTCMGLKNGLYIYMIRQFFRNIPKELEEAAYVDGCGTLKTFLSIMLPDAKPILTSCLLFAFVWQWTDKFYSRMFLGKVKLLSVQLSGLADKVNGYVIEVLKIPGGISIGYTQCLIATGTLMTIIPLIVLYLFAQKGFVESLSSSGIKM